MLTSGATTKMRAKRKSLAPRYLAQGKGAGAGGGGDEEGAGNPGEVVEAEAATKGVAADALGVIGRKERLGGQVLCGGGG